MQKPNPKNLTAARGVAVGIAQPKWRGENNMSENEISRREFNLGVAAGAAAIGSAGRALAQTREPFDLVILGGRVMDPETGFD